MKNPMRTAAALVAIALLTAACGRLNDDNGSGAGGSGSGDAMISHPTGADDLVLRIDVGGGFVAVEYNLAAVPGVSIYGDGRMVVTGPVAEIYPGPALPNLQVRQLSEDALQAILVAAKNAGLMDGDATYDYPCVADLPTTTFTVVAEGKTNVVSAYALGFDAGAGTGATAGAATGTAAGAGSGATAAACEGADTKARAELAAFQSAMGDLEHLVPAGSIGAEEPYVPTEMRVFVLPYQGQADLPQPSVAWPVTGSLETFGEPIDVPEGARCGVVGGTDLSEQLLPAATDANQLTPWTSGGSKHSLIFRPLLPDEHGC